MNRGFMKYFGRGMRTATRVLLKGGQYIAYYVWYFASLIGSSVPVVGTVFSVADARRAKIAEKEKHLTVTRAFAGLETGASFGTALLALTLRFLILLGGIAALATVGALLAYLGGFVAEAVGMRDKNVLMAVFAAPAAVAALAYAIAVWLTYAPLAFILDSNKKIGATDALTASKETMLQGGKATCFLNTAVSFLVKGAFLAAAVGVFAAFAQIPNATARAVFCVLWALMAAGLYIVFAPVFTLASQVANVLLFADISLDPAAMSNRTKGVFITRWRTENGSDEKSGGVLEDLFDRTAGAAVDPPDTKYVPPTDWADTLRTYDGDADTDGDAPAAREEDEVDDL